MLNKQQTTNNKQQTTNNKQQTTNTNPQVGNPSSQSSSSQSSTSSSSNEKATYGGLYWSSSKGRVNNFAPSSNIAELTIDGQAVGLVVGTVRNVGKLNNLEFGSFFSKDNTQVYNLVRGELTSEKQVPQSGIVNYQGQVFYGTEHSRDSMKGTSSFAVDFGQKTVSGRFNVAGKQIDLAVAKISGNTFEHRSHQREEKTQEFMRGYFFGKNAAELGGVWEREKNKTAEAAVFGATKR